MTLFLDSTQGTMLMGGLIAILGLLLGFFGAIFVSFSRRRGSTKRSRGLAQRDLVVRTVLALDNFVGASYTAVHDTRVFDADEPEQFVFHADDPSLVLPTNVNWDVLRQDLAEEIQWLPNRIQNVTDGLDTLDISGPGYNDFFQHRQEDFSRLGLEALHLINRLGETYGVKRPIRPAYYNPEIGFRKKVAEIEGFWQRRRDSQSSVPNDGSNVTPLFGAGRSQSDHVSGPKSE